MKRIVILCDGTWNSPTIPTPTNVVRLRDALVNDPDTQVVRYIPGVGVNKFANKFKALVHKLGGGAFGWGLGRNVRLAYQQLCLNYEPGDQIFIFGFSRGAYTARSLGGMIRKCGIVPKDKISSAMTLNRAWRLYKRTGAQLDKGALWKQRRALSPHVATSPRDWQERGSPADVSIVDIHFVGVWDTVGAKGLPPTLLGPIAKLYNRRYEFYDMKLSSMVKNAFHALALDEQRLLFRPNPWENLDALNGDQSGDDKPYQQKWFAGDHGTVGGSNEVRPLVAFPLEWITDRAVDLGLQLDPQAIIPDAAGDPAVHSAATDLIDGPLHDWRTGTNDISDYHWSVGARMRALGSSYSPGGAQHLRSALLSDTYDATPKTLPA